MLFLRRLQVLVLPIILYNFHSFPLYFIPANLIVVPLLEWVIIGGLLAALFFFFDALAGGILQFADYFLWAALRLNGFISSLPEASFEAGSLSLAEGILYYIGVAVFCFKRKWGTEREISSCRCHFTGAILCWQNGQCAGRPFCWRLIWEQIRGQCLCPVMRRSCIIKAAGFLRRQADGN